MGAVPASICGGNAPGDSFARNPAKILSPGGADYGYFGRTCYHPLFVLNQLGDVERCAQRSVNLHSADGWRAVLEPADSRASRPLIPGRNWPPLPI